VRPDRRVVLGALLVLALLLRVAFIRLRGDLIGGDEAIIGLMALRIAAGEAFPLIFWEAHYGGTLDAYLCAGAFLIFDPSPVVLRAAVLPLELVGIAALVSAAGTLWGTQAAVVGGLWLAAGPPLLFLFGAQAFAMYPELLAFGGLTLCLATRLRAGPRAGVGSWAGLGAAAGFGAYSSPFLLPVFVGALWALRRAGTRLAGRTWLALAVAFLVGVSPLIVYNTLAPGASALRLGSRVLDVSASEVTRATSLVGLVGSKALRYGQRLARYPLVLLDNVPAAAGLPAWGAGVAAVVVLGLVRVARAPAAAADAGFGTALLAGCGLATLLFVWLAGLDAPRHLFPFYLLAPLGLAALWASTTGWARRCLAAGLLVLLTSNATGTARAARTADPDVASLAAALEQRGVRFVYTDYAIAYPLAFLSHERIVASPAAGPTNVERYPAYTRAVAAAPRPAYVFARETEASGIFAREMRRAGRGFAHEALGEFDLYLPDARVEPHELALVRKF
jgi:hypothetical protein